MEKNLVSMMGRVSNVRYFEVPTVDVPIPNITVTAQDKNVYLLGDLTKNQLTDGMTATFGDDNEFKIDFNNSADNYGLQPWQNAYVEIKNGVTPTSYTDLKDDTTYAAQVTVEPSDLNGTVKERTFTDDANINVFLPTLTFKDNTVYYGESSVTNPDYFNTNNRVDGITWTHGSTDSADADPAMIGTVPSVDNFGLTYTSEENKIVDGKINTKEDFYVNVVATLFDQDVSQYIKFAHQACTSVCDFDSNKGEFMLHVKTCQLTIN